MSNLSNFWFMSLHPEMSLDEAYKLWYAERKKLWHRDNFGVYVDFLRKEGWSVI